MEVAVALIAGAAAKLYDDFVDMNIVSNEYYLKMLETLQCFLLGALSINNFTFTIVIIIINILNYIANNDAYNLPYEWSLLTMYPILLLLSFSSRTYLSWFDFYVVVLLLCAMFIEPILVKEDKSPRKFIYRLSSGIICLIIMIAVPMSSGVLLNVAYLAGYMFVSSMVQGYFISHMNMNEFCISLTEGFQDYASTLKSILHITA